MNELSVHYKPIGTTQRFGQSNGATVNHASDHRRAQDEWQLWQSDLPTALYEGLTINQLPEKFQMLEVISNPILGGMIATFAIGMTFTVWSVVDDWMWDRKNK
ncbi:hypothetical protein QL288_01140 [Citrobacter youngae]|nr:hypothetical protein [Citrobacter youngae]